MKVLFFFGIGTILRAAKKYYPNSKIIIFGSGAHSNIQKMESNFEVNFVRGPLTAKALGLSDQQWITDPAILTPEIFKNAFKKKEFAFSYIPHYSVANNTIKKLFLEMGIHYIDPRGSVKAIIEDIKKTEIVLAEAMHGAIVADAYRIPWIPIASYASFNHFKWHDWAKSLHLNIKIYSIYRFYENEKGLKYTLKKIRTKRTFKSICKLTPYLSDELVSLKAKDTLKQRIQFFKENAKELS